MPETPIITPALADQAKREILARLDKRIAEKGRKGFVNNYETYGKLCEEMLEFQMSIWKREDTDQKISELEDIAVGCLWGLASYAGGLIGPETMDVFKKKLTDEVDVRAKGVQPLGHYSEHESSGLLAAKIHDYGAKAMAVEAPALLQEIAVEAIWAIASYHGGMKQKKKK